MRRFGWIGVLLAAVLVLGACSDDSDSGGSDGDTDTLRAQLVDELTADGAISEDDANCIADGVFDELDADTIQAFADQEGDEPPPGFQEAMLDITLDCVDLEDLVVPEE